MASLPVLSVTTPTLNPSHSIFAKPSHFITHAKRDNRLRISCTNNQNRNDNEYSKNVETNSQGKVDRRNMLFGIGGLYGASNLVSTHEALANPIQPPNSCGSATNLNNNTPLSISCCPPFQKFNEMIIPYKLPPVPEVLRRRLSAHEVTPEYILKYNLATERMKSLPKDDPRNFMQQANIHCAYCNGAYKQVGQQSLELQIHNSWLFFPFHRWYLYFYERILGKLIDDPTFTLPFWNWDNPKGMTIPPMYLEPKSSALYNEKRNQAHLPPAVLDLGLTRSKNPDQVMSNNLSIMHTEMIRGNACALAFMGNAYREGSTEDKITGPGAVERGSHTSVHIWVGDPRQPTGEDLGNFYSAGRDPLFYCHHGNVDRMWTLWNSLPSIKVPDKSITDEDFLKSAFLFYDENAQLVSVTVEDCLDNKNMGYEYEYEYKGDEKEDSINLPWIGYMPLLQTAEDKTEIDRNILAKEEALFPLQVDKIVRLRVPKVKKGKARELLVLENITVDTTKFVKVDVFVNDKDGNVNDLNKAAYAGTYAQVPHKATSETTSYTTTIELKLTDLYNYIYTDANIDDEVLVTLVPRHEGEGLTIGDIKIIEDPNPPVATNPLPPCN